MRQLLEVPLQERDYLTPACPCNGQAVWASTPPHPSPSIPSTYENQYAPPFSPLTHRTLFLDVVFNLLYGTLYFDVHIFWKFIGFSYFMGIETGFV
jgi:hypothetical protein